MSNPWTEMLHFCGRRAIFDRFKLGAIGLLCAILLSSCGESPPRGYGGSASSNTLSPIAAPPGSSENPPLPGTTGTPKTPDGLPALSAKGLNTSLFSSRVDNTDSRMGRLENAVQELRNDFDAISPAIVRLVSIEQDIQNLIAQLEVLTNGTAPAPIVDPIDSELLTDTNTQPIQPIEAPIPPTPQNPLALAENLTVTPQTAPTPAPAPVATNSGIAVTGIRIGNYKDKVRIVLDATAKASFTADLDNNEKILVVELPQTGWRTDMQKTFAQNAVLSSYKTEQRADGGTRLIIQLKSRSSILYQITLPNPNGTSRLVLDLKTP